MKKINIAILNYSSGNCEIVHDLQVPNNFTTEDVENILDEQGYDVDTISWMELGRNAEFRSCEADSNNNITLMYTYI